MAEYDASNPKHIAIARRTAKVADQSRLEFVKYVMSMVDGRAYIHDLLLSCHVFAPSLFSTDANATSFSCGRHSVGQQILAEVMAACPDDYIKMMREYNARSIADDTRRSRSDTDSNGDDRGPEPAPYIHPAFRDDSPTTPDSEYNPGDEDRDEV